MGHAATSQRLSATEYLEWERAQPTKHEYHLGEVFAMAGGSPRHNFLSSAVGAELRAALRGKDCHVLSSDQRISARPGERYVYADTVAVCGGFQMEPGTNAPRSRLGGDLDPLEQEHRGTPIAGPGLPLPSPSPSPSPSPK